MQLADLRQPCTGFKQLVRRLSFVWLVLSIGGAVITLYGPFYIYTTSIGDVGDPPAIRPIYLVGVICLIVGMIGQWFDQRFSLPRASD